MSPTSPRARVADTAAIVGAGPLGLLILQLLKLAGAGPIFISDKLPWRLKAAERYGGVPIHCELENFPTRIQNETGGRGVDVAVEAAWADQSVEDAAAAARLGGRLVLVGIPSDDRLSLKASTARRKGLTMLMCRRMKHVYPRAIRLALDRRVDLLDLVSHRFPLARASEAFRLNAAYADNVTKVVIES
jgi:L-iditol 2-dehydrogenase